jgi:predicted nucleotide-binding protein (sugar kinase/HSP70/actin superfamily)
VEYEADLLFRHVHEVQPPPESGTPIDDIAVSRAWFGYGPIRRRPVSRTFLRSSAEAAARRRDLRIGIPRVLGIYSVAPFLRGYLEALGIAPKNIVFSDETSEELWREGGAHGSIDPCFPSKVALAHLHNLLRRKHGRKRLDYIWFPSITDTPTYVSHTLGSTSCPILAGAPKVAAAAFTKERDSFAEAGVDYVSDVLNFEVPHLLRHQLHQIWGERLGVSGDESDWASRQGWRAMQLCDRELQRRGHEVLAQAERDNDVVLLMLGRPYHGDPGLNHDVLEEFQALGHPILSMRSIPKDPHYLEPYFAEDLQTRRIADIFDVRDVWPENFSTNSVQKVWAAKFAARHPNVAVIDLSSFKCGQDAPAYGLIDAIVAAGKTPYLALHDIDANKPTGSINIRVKTYAYALGLRRERLLDEAARRSDLERAVRAKRAEVLARQKSELEQRMRETWPEALPELEAAFDAYLAEHGLKTDDDGSSRPDSEAAPPGGNGRAFHGVPFGTAIAAE